MLTPACPRLLDMINDFVLLRFWARAPRGFKRYRSYITLLLYKKFILSIVNMYEITESHSESNTADGR